MRSGDPKAACPSCSLVGGVEFRRLPRMLFLAISVPPVVMLFWTGGSLVWRTTILVATLLYVGIPTFGRCGSCNTRLQQRAFGSGWVVRS